MRRILFLLLMVCGLALTGCTTMRESLPDRTATEQLLLSGAIDRAIDRLKLELPREAKVYIPTEEVEAYEKAYLLAAFRDRVLREGGLIVRDPAAADLIVAVRSAAASIDKRSDLVGLPSFEIPVPVAGPFSTPELALFKRQRLEGIAKLYVTSYHADSGRLYRSSGPALGRSLRDRVVILFVSWTDWNPPRP